MEDLSQALRSSGALGSVYWEPAWVSTGCSTRWGQGSHWENAAFFDFHANDELLPVIAYMNERYAAVEAADGELEAEYVSPLAEDVEGDTSNSRAELDLVSLSVYAEDGWLHVALTMGDEPLASAGSIYRIYFDTIDGGGGNLDIGDRPIVIADPYQAEYVLEIQIVEAAGTVVPEGRWFTWDGSSWQESAFVGSLAASGNHLEASLALAWLGEPQDVDLAAISAGRVLNRSAADILGTDATPAQPTDTAEVHSFFALELPE
jgi:hypothetical protein